MRVRNESDGKPPNDFGGLFHLSLDKQHTSWHNHLYREHTEIIVMNGEAMSPEQESVQDLIAIVTVFASRLHGLRSYKKVIKDAALQKDKA